MDEYETWCSTRINSRTLVVSYIYNDLSEILIENSIPIPFAGGVNVVITNSNIFDFQPDIKAVFEQLNK